jgi:hypothetical protein
MVLYSQSRAVTTHSAARGEALRMCGNLPPRLKNLYAAWCLDTGTIL